MSDFTKLPHDIAQCMDRAGSPMSEDQKLLLAGYLAPVQQQLAKAETENERVRQANLHTMDVFEQMKAAKEQAEARCAELMEVGSDLCWELESWLATEDDEESVGAIRAWKRLRNEANEIKAGGDL